MVAVRPEASPLVDITGLDRPTVIAALYNAARPQGLGFLAYDPESMTPEAAAPLVGRYLDYVKGRVMKLIIRADDDSFDEWGYDRDNGKGSAARVVMALREGAAGHVAAEIHGEGKARAVEDARAMIATPTTTDIHAGGRVAVVNLGLADEPELKAALAAKLDDTNT